MININTHQKAKNIFIICMISVLMGQFYISPFDTVFRLTLAVFFMSLFLIYFEDYSIMTITMSVGVSTFFFRSIVYYLGSTLPFQEVLLIYFPVLTYYVFFGLMFKFLSVRSYYEQPFNFFLSLWVCDSMSNIIEALVRKSWELISFDELVIAIVIVGGIRTFMTLFAYYIGRYFHVKIKKKESEKYYNELILFISKLKTELFFLNKSRNDIEEMVAYAHHHYNEAIEDDIKKPLLKIAKDTHEIKKDYLRVIAGMNSIFNADTQIKFMSIKDILYIVKDNLDKLILDKQKKITLTVHYNRLFVTDEFYTIISILNNLTVNSIDAISTYGTINITVNYSDDFIVFIVSDNGEGIPESKIDMVFNVGYTMKYDSTTGNMSTGLGLSHVKQLVTDNLNGEVTIDSKLEMGTAVTVKVPVDSLLKRGQIK